MGAIRVQVVLHTVDGVPANFVSNSFCFMGADPFGDKAAITTALKNFYSSFNTTYLSNAIAQNGHEAKYYDLPGVKPNYPLAEDVWNLTSAPTGGPLPSEIALCCTFHGARTPGFPQARRRGRIYLGPLGTVTNASNGRPSPAFITAAVTGLTGLKAAIDALASDTEWAVWSATNASPVDITGGWVDNAWDIQRRRGVEENARTVW